MLFSKTFISLKMFRGLIRRTVCVALTAGNFKIRQTARSFMNHFTNGPCGVHALVPVGLA